MAASFDFAPVDEQEEETMTEPDVAENEPDVTDSE